MDITFILYILYLLFIWGGISFMIYYIIPQFQKKKEENSFYNLNQRNLIILRELLPPLQKASYDEIYEEMEIISVKSFRQFMIISGISFSVFAIPDFLPISELMFQIIKFPAVIIWIFFFIKFIRVGSLPNIYSRVWQELLNQNYDDLNFGIVDWLNEKIEPIRYIMARKYVSTFYENNFHQKFDTKLVSMLETSHYKKKTEEPLSMTLELCRLEHLWYDQNIVIKNKYEKYKAVITIGSIGSIFLYAGLMLYYFVYEDSDQLNNQSNLQETLFVISIPLFTFLFLRIISNSWYNTPNLDREGVIEFLTDRGIEHNVEDSFITMRNFIDQQIKIVIPKDKITEPA